MFLLSHGSLLHNDPRIPWLAYFICSFSRMASSLHAFLAALGSLVCSVPHALRLARGQCSSPGGDSLIHSEPQPGRLAFRFCSSARMARLASMKLSLLGSLPTSVPYLQGLAFLLCYSSTLARSSSTLLHDSGSLFLFVPGHKWLALFPRSS
jgi:hypothetical protein